MNDGMARFLGRLSRKHTLQEGPRHPFRPMFTGISHYKNSGHRAMYKFRPLCHNGCKVGIMKAECRKPSAAEAMAGKEEERVHPPKPSRRRRKRRGCGPARRVWRPAEHISALLNTSCAKRGTVRRETPRTATGTVALPDHSPASHRYTILGGSPRIYLKCRIHEQQEILNASRKQALPAQAQSNLVKVNQGSMRKRLKWNAKG